MRRPECKHVRGDKVVQRALEAGHDDVVVRVERSLIMMEIAIVIMMENGILIMMENLLQV
jgi:hypothetical protein